MHLRLVEVKKISRFQVIAAFVTQTSWHYRHSSVRGSQSVKDSVRKVWQQQPGSPRHQAGGCRNAYLIRPASQSSSPKLHDFNTDPTSLVNTTHDCLITAYTCNPGRRRDFPSQTDFQRSRGS